MKKEYMNPIIEIIEFEVSDIVTTSTFDNEGIMDSENFDTWYS